MLSGGFRCLKINSEKKLKVTLQFENSNLDMAALLSWKLDRVPFFTTVVASLSKSLLQFFLALSICNRHKRTWR